MNELRRNFPLPEIQQGAMLGNGLVGATIWGSGNILNLTIGCASLWDHRGGMEWNPSQNYYDICKLLKDGDTKNLLNLFKCHKDGNVQRPSLIPLGRVVIRLPEDCMLIRYVIKMNRGEVRILYRWKEAENTLEFSCDMNGEAVFVCRGLNKDMTLELKSSWELFQGRDYSLFQLCENNSLKERGFDPPQFFHNTMVQAFCQAMPADPAFALLLKRKGSEFSAAFFRGESDPTVLAKRKVPSYQEIHAKSSSWWKRFWKNIPRVKLEDPDLDEIYRSGLYKYGIMSNPSGVTPGLQGPWIEDDRLPPWQGDYHFNINVQMCVSPGYRAGLFFHLRPLFEMVLSWREKLRENARCFVSIPDGYMLPHAVDDRCTCMGNFWCGTNDHACGAWIAMMMYEYCDYSGDFEFLKNDVFDFMQGIMNVFKSMLLRKSDVTLSLPVSISPEYGEGNPAAWGSNSSFQLAAIHSLNRCLIKAAEKLNLPQDPFWHEIEAHLRLCSVYGNEKKREIGLWDGQALEMCHRHHSHLGGLVPFGVIDPDDPNWAEILSQSELRWTSMGTGQWTGWAFPWASQLRTRLKHQEAAVMLLKFWKEYYNNAGGGSLHDARCKGISIYDFRGEVMQMDGAMGAVTAIQDMLCFSHDNIHCFFYGIPKAWKKTEFRGLFLPGGFLADGCFEHGRTTSLVIRSRRGEKLMFRTADTKELFQLPTSPGELLRFGLQNGVFQRLENAKRSKK